MKKTTVILLDGGYVLNRIRSILGDRHYPDANTIYEFSQSLIEDDEEIFRIFFYHAEPFKGTKKRPLSGELYKFSENPVVNYTESLFNELGKKDYIALRRGEILFQGWKLNEGKIDDIKHNYDKQVSLEDKDFDPELTQKGVDIRIGLDVAWVASKRIVDRIILVTGDTDFVPAMKFARKEGLQVVLIKVGNQALKENLYHHSDLIRSITYNNDDNKWVLEC